MRQRHDRGSAVRQAVCEALEARQLLAADPVISEFMASNGKTLADVAKAQNKTVDGLVDAIVADAKQHLDAAVKAGRITKSQEDSLLSDIKTRTTDFVNGKAPRFGFRHFDGGPPRGDDTGLPGPDPGI